MEPIAVFIVNKETGLIEYVLMFDAIADAEEMFPNNLCVKRVVGNQHLEIGDVLS